MNSLNRTVASCSVEVSCEIWVQYLWVRWDQTTDMLRIRENYLSPKDDQRLIHSIYYAPENELADEHLFCPWCVSFLIYALSWSSGPTVIHVDVHYVANEVCVPVWVPPQTHTVGLNNLVVCGPVGHLKYRLHFCLG